jgi:putative spermidine/putrescine transport system ATP-binding protein
VLLGPSGCGKTTTLRMIAGFVEPTAAQSASASKDITTCRPGSATPAWSSRATRCFPHMTVNNENVAFGLEMRKVDKAEIAGAWPRRCASSGSITWRALPRQLSGGQQQRVALARALVIRPDVLLLDEPLSNLDAKLRLEVRLEIRELQQQLGLTTVMVTHDQEEALTMADRLVVMSDGKHAPGRHAVTTSTSAPPTASSPISSAAPPSSKAPSSDRAVPLGRRACDLPAPPMPPSGPATHRAAAGAPDARSGGRRASTTTPPARSSFVSYLGAPCSTCMSASPEPSGSSCQMPNRPDERPLPAVGDTIRSAGRPRPVLAFRRRLPERPVAARTNAAELGNPEGRSRHDEFTKNFRRTTLASLSPGAAALLPPALADPGVRPVQGPRRRRHLGRRLCAPAQQERREPILIKPKGWEVVQDQASDDPQRRSKMLAERRLPRGTTDIQGLSAAQHVRDERRRPRRADRLFQAEERRQHHPDR